MSKPVFEDLFALRGRRNRKSYFLFVLAWIVIGSIVAAVFMVSIGPDGAPSGGVAAMTVIAALALLVTSWTTGAQRCRDFGWTGWAVLLSAVPFVGWVFPFVMLFVPGTVGPNRYGPDPVGGAMPVAA